LKSRFREREKCSFGEHAFIPDVFNESEFVRNVLQSYIVDNTLIEVSDLEALKRENRLLYNTVEELKKDKERLWKEIEQYRNIYLPKPKRHWWEFWKSQKTE